MLTVALLPAKSSSAAVAFFVAPTRPAQSPVMLT
jgi:hypothetical protein